MAVGARELRVALNGEAGANQLLSLDTSTGTFLTLARDLQRHPVAQTVTHVDFVIVRRDEVISADVPITLVGEATQVHNAEVTSGYRHQVKADVVVPQWAVPVG